MRTAVIASLIFREILRSGVRKRSLESCCVRVEAPRILSPRVTDWMTALGIAKMFSPQWR